MASPSYLHSLLSNLHRHVTPNPFEAPQGNVVGPARPQRAAGSHSMINFNDPRNAILLFKILGGLSVNLSQNLMLGYLPHSSCQSSHWASNFISLALAWGIVVPQCSKYRSSHSVVVSYAMSRMMCFSSYGRDSLTIHLQSEKRWSMWTMSFRFIAVFFKCLKSFSDAHFQIMRVWRRTPRM